MDFEGFVTPKRALNVADFEALLDLTFSWAGANFAGMEPLRKEEKRLCLDIVQAIDSQTATDFLRSRAPWARRHDDEVASPEKVAFDRELVSVLENKAVDAVARLFGISGAIASVAGDAEKSAERFLLFRHSSALWSSAGADVLRELSHGDRAIVRENVMELLDDLVGRAKENAGMRDEVSPKELTDLTSDGALIAELWNIATSKPPPVLRFRGVEEIRTVLERNTGTALATPAWWSDVRRAADALPKARPSSKPR